MNVLGRSLLYSLMFMTAALSSAQAAAGRELEIYFIDVEGGQSTLIITPDGHSLLVDTGWAGDGTGFRPGNPQKLAMRTELWLPRVMPASSRSTTC
jgi:hypothetical protein